MRDVAEQTGRQGPGIVEGGPRMSCKGRVRCILETLRELVKNFEQRVTYKICMLERLSWQLCAGWTGYHAQKQEFTSREII